MSSYDSNDRELWPEEVEPSPFWEFVGRICVYGVVGIVVAFFIARGLGL